MRDVSFMKPAKFQDYLTLTELSREVKKDTSWLKELERSDRIPQAARVKVGQLSVRLWSPAQVQEIKTILSKMRPGRPKKNG
jgi:hypothetical protein